ncbi:MAG: AgmX/PglI C-terminal domain-containing protein [Pseudomonadota bacterium]
MTLYALSHDFDLLANEADRRFQRWLGTFGIPALVLALLIPFLQLTGLTPGGGLPVPPRYAQLVPPPVVEPAVKEEQPKPEPKTKPKVEKPKVSQEVLKQQQQQKARARATKEISKSFSSIANLLSTSAKSDNPLVAAVTPTKSGSTSPVFASSATSSSKGIGNVAPTARTQSGTGLGQRKTSDVSGPTGIGADPGAPGLSGDKRIAGRSLGEMQEVFDRNKGAFYSLYNRALRENPDLVGKLIFDITIEPDGSVSRCVLVKSELGNPELERKFVLLVQQLNFGAKGVPRFNYPNYPLHLLRS